MVSIVCCLRPHKYFMMIQDFFKAQIIIVVIISRGKQMDNLFFSNVPVDRSAKRLIYIYIMKTIILLVAWNNPRKQFSIV